MASLPFMLVFMGGKPARGERPAADVRVERLIEAEDLADAGEAKGNFHLLVSAACARAAAGDMASIDADRSPYRVLTDQEDDLSVERLLSRALALAPPSERAGLEAARGEANTGRPLDSTLCDPRDQGVRGAGYVVRLSTQIPQQQTKSVDLPRLKPDEPIVISVRADGFGLISFQLLGPAGLACRSPGPAARTVYCTALPPGGAQPAGGYRLSLTNHAGLVTRISIYVS